MNCPWHYLDNLPKGIPIAWDRVNGVWRQGMGRLLMRFGNLVGSRRCASSGARTLFTGRIQQRYGVAKDEAQRLMLACDDMALDPWYTAGGSRYDTLAPDLPLSTAAATPPSQARRMETR